MNLLNLPDNCGSVFLSHFYSGDYSYNGSSREVYADFNKLARSGLYYSKAVALAITTPNQKFAVSVLKRKKGIILGYFINQNSGLKNYIWMIPLNQNSTMCRQSNNNHASLRRLRRRR